MTACYEGSIGTALIAWLVLTMWFSLRFPLASARGMMTVNQMLAQGIRKGIPLMEHGSTKTCLVALNPILAMFVGGYLEQWLTAAPVEYHNAFWGFRIDFSMSALLISHLFGYAFSAVAHFTYLKAKYPEADIEPDRNGKLGRLTPCGWVHALYFGEAVSLLFQICAFTRGIPGLEMFLLTTYMVGHIWLGNHFWNRIAKPDWFPDDYSFWALDAWVPVVLVLIVLSYATWVKVRVDARTTVGAFLHPAYPVVMFSIVPIRTS